MSLFKIGECGYKAEHVRLKKLSFENTFRNYCILPRSDYCYNLIRLGLA